MSTTTIGLRVTRQQWKTFKAAADQEGLTASDWLRKIAQNRVDQKQEEDRLNALEQRLTAALKLIADRQEAIRKILAQLETAE